MEIAQDQKGSVTIVSIKGSLDAFTAPMLSEFLNKQIADGHLNLVANLGQLDYTSSAGLRVLLNAVKATRARGGDLRIAAAQTKVENVFEMI